MVNNKFYNYRHLARLIIEAQTPLAIGNGESNVLTDRLVSRDVNGLPYIPGSTLAGIIRHTLKESGLDDSFFGFSDPEGGEGSQIVITSAYLVGEDGIIVDDLTTINFASPFYSAFMDLPVRQHVRINEKGTAVKYGKYDEEVVYKGSRFGFEIELLSEDNHTEIFDKVLAVLSYSGVRIGGGSRKGLGEIRIVEEECRAITLNLSVSERNTSDFVHQELWEKMQCENDLEVYLKKTANLNDSFWSYVPGKEISIHSKENWETYEFSMKACDFFLFGSGSGDDEADIVPVTENVIVWEGEMPHFEVNNILLPGSSIKGALAHRVAFYYNKSKGITAELLKEDRSIELLERNNYLPFGALDGREYKDRIALTTVYNPAVRSLFGFSYDEKHVERGNVIMSDIIFPKEEEESVKLFNHVAIDRFTGGAINGALFSEKVISSPEKDLNFKFKVSTEALQEPDIKQAWENALEDLKNGMLPLGGGTNRGHGRFKSILLNNKEE